MRYEFVPGSSRVFVRLHAFLHKATAEATDVRGWFEVDGDRLLAGQVSGEATIAVDDFDFGNPLLARTARAWVNERKRSDLRFVIGSATPAEGRVVVAGQLTIGDTTELIETDAEVVERDDQVVISGSWSLSQKQFHLQSPPGVKDAVDIEFRLVAARV